MPLPVVKTAAVFLAEDISVVKIEEGFRDPQKYSERATLTFVAIYVYGNRDSVLSAAHVQAGNASTTIMATATTTNPSPGPSFMNTAGHFHEPTKTIL